METLLNEAIALAAVMSPIILGLVQLIKKSELNHRWLPYISVGVGVLAGVIFGVAQNADLFLYGLAGLVSGLSASGLYDVGKSTKG